VLQAPAIDVFVPSFLLRLRSYGLLFFPRLSVSLSLSLSISFSFHRVDRTRIYLFLSTSWSFSTILLLGFLKLENRRRFSLSLSLPPSLSLSLSLSQSRRCEAPFPDRAAETSILMPENRFAIPLKSRQRESRHAVEQRESLLGCCGQDAFVARRLPASRFIELPASSYLLSLFLSFSLSLSLSLSFRIYRC